MPEVHFEYILANRAGYRFDVCDMRNNVYDISAMWQKNLFKDTLVTRPQTSTDLFLLHNRALLSINGFIQPTVMNGTKLIIPNGSSYMLKSRSNQVGILSFNKLNANIIKTQITPAMVTAEGNTPLYEKAIITFNEDIGTVFLVIAGYMIFEDSNVLYRVSPKSFALRLDRLNYIEKLYELQTQRDIFTELAIPASNVNPSLIDAVAARSNEVITKYLSLNNSFLVTLPTTNLMLKKVYLERSNIPATFNTQVNPTMPMLGGYGKLLEYTKKKITSNRYKVNTLDGYYNNYLMTELPYNQVILYNDHRVPGVTYRLVQAYFLDMYTNQP